VVVAYQNQIVMEPTLDAALARLFGGPGTPPPAERQTTGNGSAPPPQPAAAAGATAIASLVGEARTHYDRAVEAQRAGDWAKYGEELRLLGDALKRMPNR